MFYLRFLSITNTKNLRSRWHIDSSFILDQPGNFDIQRKRSLNVMPRTRYIYFDISISHFVYRSHPLDNRYGFFISVKPEIAQLFRLSFHCWKNCFHNFQKLAGLWLVVEVVNQVAIYGSKAKGCSAFQRRSRFHCKDIIHQSLLKIWWLDTTTDHNIQYVPVTGRYVMWFTYLISLWNDSACNKFITYEH